MAQGHGRVESDPGSHRRLVEDDPVRVVLGRPELLERLPGALAFVGARPPDVEEIGAPQNHSNRVVFDEAAMAAGAALYAAVALRHLA